MPARLPRRRPRAGAAAVVLGLHLLGASLLFRLGAWHDRGQPPAERPPLVVRLLPWLQSQVPPPVAASARPTRRTPDAMPPSTPPQATPRPAERQAIALPPTASPSVAASETRSAAPLDLSLPRAASAPWRQRNPALDDPRANTARRTLEGSIAAVLGGGDQITQEQLQDGSIRFRRGSQCVVAHPNRAQQLDSFNSSVLPKPRLMDKC